MQIQQAWMYIEEKVLSAVSLRSSTELNLLSFSYGNVRGRSDFAQTKIGGGFDLHTVPDLAT